jgi:hypothetical protein
MREIDFYNLLILIKFICYNKDIKRFRSIIY